jgi:alkylhydroperoxidase/carboxymuconolactone decarboxylase family protein YurZ
MPDPPQAHKDFITRYPQLGQAWELISTAGHQGTLDEKTIRLLKLATAIGAMREGSVHASVRKALALGIPRAEIEQVVAVAAAVLGLPAIVAAHTWVQDELGGSAGPTADPKRP